jgi:hypothetical protein
LSQKTDVAAATNLNFVNNTTTGTTSGTDALATNTGVGSRTTGTRSGGVRVPAPPSIFTPRLTMLQTDVKPVPLSGSTHTGSSEGEKEAV